MRVVNAFKFHAINYHYFTIEKPDSLNIESNTSIKIFMFIENY